MGRVPDRDFGDAAGYESIKVFTVACRGDLFVRPEEYHGPVDFFQESGQVLANPRGVEQDAARGGSPFRKGYGDGGAAEGVSNQDNPVHVDAAVDNFRRAVDGLDQSRQDSAVTDPRSVVGELQGQTMHAPPRHVPGLVLMRLLRAL